MTRRPSRPRFPNQNQNIQKSTQILLTQLRSIRAGGPPSSLPPPIPIAVPEPEEEEDEEELDEEGPASGFEGLNPLNARPASTLFSTRLITLFLYPPDRLVEEGEEKEDEDEEDEDEGGGHLIPSYARRILSIERKAVGRWNSIVCPVRVDRPFIPFTPCPLTPLIPLVIGEEGGPAGFEVANIDPKSLPSSAASSIAQVVEQSTCGGGACAASPTSAIRGPYISFRSSLSFEDE